MPILELVDLEKTYTIGEVKVPILKKIKLQIYAGEFVALMGPSGSGKSTLMNIIGCLDRPSGGHILLKNEDISNLSEEELARIRREEIGFIFQTFNLIGRISVLKNVELPMIFREKSRDERILRAQDLLGMVGLKHRLDYSPLNLSGGERQRVAIARALANNPAIILADEPTGNLDLKSTRDIMDIIRKLNDDGHTIIMVTHDADTTEHCNRVIQLRDGKILEGAS